MTSSASADDESFTVEELALVAARLVLEQQAIEELPDIATRALVAGFDSPALAIAAGTPASDVRDARERFLEALDELGVVLPDRREAWWLLVRRKAADIVAGVVSPHDGACWLWRNAYLGGEPAGDLRIFIGLASEWEDHPDGRADYDTATIRAAEALLNRPGPRRWVRVQAREGSPPIWDYQSKDRSGCGGLQMSPELSARFTNWAGRYDDTQREPGPGPSGFQTPAAAKAFVDEGRQLVADLQNELGDEWQVEYMPTASAFPARSSGD